MRIAVAYSLLFLYAVALLKPVLPPLFDWASHTFVLDHHLATVHHHHGHDHVEKQMAHEAEKDDHETKSPAAGFSEPVSVHVMTPLSCLLSLQSNDFLSRYSPFAESLCRPYFFLDVPPPRSIS